MHSSTWKKGERRIARIFNTRRNPLSGGNSGHTKSDTLHSSLFIEIKHRKKYPLSKLWESVVENSVLEGKIPLMIFLKNSSQYPLILCRLKDIKFISKSSI